MLLPIFIVHRIFVFLSGPATFSDSRADGFRISGASFPGAASGARLGNVEHTSNVISGVGDRRGPMARRGDGSVCHAAATERWRQPAWSNEKGLNIS